MDDELRHHSPQSIDSGILHEPQRPAIATTPNPDHPANDAGDDFGATCDDKFLASLQGCIDRLRVSDSNEFTYRHRQNGAMSIS